MYSTIKRLFPLFSLFLILPGCVPAGNDYDVLKAQVNQHDQILNRLNSQVSNVQPAQADTWSQVQSMRQEVAAMRGELESLNGGLAQTGGAAAMGETLARHERALRLIETQLAMDLQLGQTAGKPQAYQGAGTGMASQTPPAGSGYVPPVQTPGSLSNQPQQPATPVTQAPSANAQQGSNDMARQLYDAGMQAFNTRRYEQGLKSFTDFTEVYPSHNLASNAWFWQGECHYQLKNYAAAALSYEKVIGQFPNSNKAPAAYLKQGLAFAQLNKADAARERLTQLAQKYPKSPEATRALQEIKKL